MDKLACSSGLIMKLCPMHFGADFNPGKDICVWHTESRILAARCQLGNIALELVVIYAPLRGRGSEEQEMWWNHVDQVVRKRDNRALLSPSETAIVVLAALRQKQLGMWQPILKMLVALV